MDVSSLASQTAKLIDALEKTSSSPGAELKSSGPSAEPDSALVQEFEAQMQNPDLSSSESSRLEQKDSVQISTESRQAVEIHDHYEHQTVHNKDYNDVDYILQELKSASGPLADGTITPEELLRVQFITGMYRNQVVGGSKVSQSAAQDIDTLLKQQS